MNRGIYKQHFLTLRTVSLFIFSLVVIMSCAKEEDYLTEKFVDIWEPIQYKWDDCIDDGVDNSVDSEDCKCSFISQEGDFSKMEILSNNTLNITKQVNTDSETISYSYSFDESTQMIMFDDNTANFESIHWTPAGLIVEGLKDGCLSTHRMRRL